MTDSDLGITPADGLATFGPVDEDQIPDDVKHARAYGERLYYDALFEQCLDLKHRAESRDKAAA